MLSKPSVMLLGLIYERPINAYEMIKLLNTMNVKWWYNIADSTVYSTLKTLEKKGLIAGATEKVGNMPDRTVYSITQKGGNELRETLKSFILRFDYDTNVFTIAAFFLGVFPADEQSLLLHKRLDLLGKYRDGIQKQLAVLKGNNISPVHIANIERMAELIKAEMWGTGHLLNHLSSQP